jgi:hypothetical protein
MARSGVSNFPGAVVVVAHDRYLLDAVAQIRNWIADRTYSGRYTQYAAVRAKQRAPAVEYERQQGPSPEEEFIRRYMAGRKRARREARQAIGATRTRRASTAKGVKPTARGYAAARCAGRARLVVGYAGDKPTCTSHSNCSGVGVRRSGSERRGQDDLPQDGVEILQPMSGRSCWAHRSGRTWRKRTTRCGSNAHSMILDVRICRRTSARADGYYLSQATTSSAHRSAVGGERSARSRCLRCKAPTFTARRATNHLDLNRKKCSKTCWASSPEQFFVSHDRYLVDRHLHLWVFKTTGVTRAVRNTETKKMPAQQAANKVPAEGDAEARK